MDVTKMAKLKLILLILISVIFITVGVAFAGEKLLFSFEEENSGWEIPDWALEKEDHVADNLQVSKNFSDEGKSSLQLTTKFPGGKWTTAYVEVQQYFDWTPYSAVSVDVYLPQSAPVGLKGKLILTVGESWQWVEMARSISLEPGKWTILTANLMPASTDWRTTVDDAFRQDVRKVGIRIESNMKPAYQGDVYIDNFRLLEKS